MYDLQVKLEENTIKSTTEQAKLNGELERYNTISDDATLGFAKRGEAAKKALTQQLTLSENVMNLAKQEVEIINTRVEQAKRQGDINRELLQEQADAQAKLIDAENDYNLKVYQNRQSRAQLTQDIAEKDLDIYLDDYANKQAINQQLIADETRVVEERQKLLNQTKAMGDESFAYQISTLQGFTDKTINAQQLLTTESSVEMQKRIRDLGLSEIMEGRLLEVIRDRRTEINDLKNAETEKYETEWTEKDVIDCFDVTFNSGINGAMSEFDHPFILSEAKRRNLNIINIGERQNLKNRRTEILITNYKLQQTLFDCL